MNPRYHRYRPHISRVARRAARFVWYGTAAVLVLLAVLYTVARLMLPQLAERKAEIEQYLSAKSDHTVRIEILSTFWDGLYPGVFIEGLRIYAGDNRRPAVRLAEVRISLALLPLLWGRLEVHRLVLTEPTLTVERLSDGRFRVSGFDPMPVAEDSADEKFINWLLSQNEFIIQRGQVRWVDQKSKEPPLLLSQIEAHLKNSGERHRLGITARFPAAVCRECALVLDIRGNPLAEPDWNGEIYVRAADLDLDALPFIVRERLPRGVHGKLNASYGRSGMVGSPMPYAGSSPARR